MTYVGIDLGTTNSAIATYDGKVVKIHRSPEDNEVTPSAIFFNARGARFVGSRAYDQEARMPGRGAKRFKRLMGTSSPIEFPDAGQTMRPEEASAAVLSALFGYLPEEIRKDEFTATIITIPAAFNQMQREATLEAAQLANIGQVALMQEPVAAVMSVMAEAHVDGVFVVLDLGGGTLDVAIAESHAGRVNLLSHGGVAMLGGSDFDRLLFDHVVKPWLFDTFTLPPDFAVDPDYRRLHRVALWATEKAKIQLSNSDESAQINVAEDEIGIADEDGNDIFIEVSITRSRMDSLIRPLLEQAVAASRAALKDASLTTGDVARLVFVGGPTRYKPLRDFVLLELGIETTVNIDPMTAVAGGAAIFAESIDWSSEQRTRKRARATVNAGQSISFKYNARTPDVRVKISIGATGQVDDGAAFEFVDVQTGWNSGRIEYPAISMVEVPIPTLGEHVFLVHGYAPTGEKLDLTTDRIVITRTAASIDAIPASHSIKVEAKNKAGGSIGLVALVRKGEQLPKQGQITFRAEHHLVSGSDDSLNFNLWEGESDIPNDGGQPIGSIRLLGEYLLEETIRAGADLIFKYEIADSGAISASVSVPSVQQTFGDFGNLYAYQEGARDFNDAADEVQDDLRQALSKLGLLESTVSDHRLDEARRRLEEVEEVDLESAEAEAVKRVDETIRESRRLLSEVRRENRALIQRTELARLVKDFDDDCREPASLAEEAAFDNLVRTTTRAIDSGSSEADEYLRELRSQIFNILWQQSWFVQSMFDGVISTPWRFADRAAFEENVAEGRAAIDRGDMSRLRGVVLTLFRTRTEWGTDDENEMDAMTNIIYKG